LKVIFLHEHMVSLVKAWALLRPCQAPRRSEEVGRLGDWSRCWLEFWFQTPEIVLGSLWESLLSSAWGHIWLDQGLLGPNGHFGGGGGSPVSPETVLAAGWKIKSGRSHVDCLL